MFSKTQQFRLILLVHLIVVENLWNFDWIGSNQSNDDFDARNTNPPRAIFLFK
jgi:hypothetical protein